MLIHSFGAKSSLRVTRYALRKMAKDNEGIFSPERIDAVFRDFYVDGLLKLFVSERHAVEVSRQLQELLVRGGFQLTKLLQCPVSISY